MKATVDRMSRELLAPEVTRLVFTLLPRKFAEKDM